ncbi:hypothetical protein D3C87_1720680 [compost metagenome]
MLDPQRAVLVEGCDAFGWRNELATPFLGGRLDELHDGLLGRPVIPGCQRVSREHRRRSDQAQPEYGEGRAMAAFNVRAKARRSDCGVPGTLHQYHEIHEVHLRWMG